MALRVCTERHLEALIFEEKGKDGLYLRCPLCLALEEIERLSKLVKEETSCSVSR